MNQNHEVEQTQNNQLIEILFHVCKTEKYMKT